MTTPPTFASAGTVESKIGVRLSYRIVRLFSEGLYTSPNKAIEELVANSFDAGALRVAVLLDTDFNQQGSTLVVIDDGESMDEEGLQKHWLIGKSFKRVLANLPKGRQQIGQFGIGKLATYVLANRLTYITKKSGKFYSTSMDYRVVDERGDARHCGPPQRVCKLQPGERPKRASARGQPRACLGLPVCPALPRFVSVCRAD